jgi:alcohol dehydrogenase class IV
MVKPFQFASLPKIFFKSGILSELPGMIGRFGNKVLVVTGKHSFLNSVQSEKLFNDLKQKGITYHVLKVEREPSPQLIDHAVRRFKGEKIDLIVGIGGGSVLDAGKAVSAMLYKSESITEFLEVVGSKEHPGTKIPFIAVPTTSGTGSEATKNAVITQIGENGFKRSLRHDNFIPDIALVDPELTLHCPAHITAASGMDCFTQLTEAYLSDKASEYTDALALSGLKHIKSSLVSSCFDGENLTYRSGMSFAATTSGICLANAGLGVVHGFASSLGGRYNIPHGLICGTLMASANEVSVRKLRQNPEGKTSLAKYAILGELFLDEKGKTSDHYIDGFIDYLHQLTETLGLNRLGHYGVEEKDLDQICRSTENKNNPVKLGPEEMKELIKNRL